MRFTRLFRRFQVWLSFIFNAEFNGPQVGVLIHCHEILIALILIFIYKFETETWWNGGWQFSSRHTKLARQWEIKILIMTQRAFLFLIWRCHRVSYFYLILILIFSLKRPPNFFSRAFSDRRCAHGAIGRGRTFSFLSYFWSIFEEFKKKIGYFRFLKKNKSLDRCYNRYFEFRGNEMEMESMNVLYVREEHFLNKRISNATILFDFVLFCFFCCW